MFSFRWKLLALALLFLILPIVMNLGWQKWFVSIPQPLPSQSSLQNIKTNQFLPGDYYETSIPLMALTAQNSLAEYRLWIPQSGQSLRGLIVRQHGCGDAAKATGLDHANDLQWQALAAKHQFALLGTKLPTIYPMCTDEAGVDGVAERTFLSALTALADKSNHPELDKVPWALWGHSGGADWSMQMLHRYPSRVIAVVNVRCGGILFSSGKSEILDLAPDSILAIRNTPVLWASGEQDPNVDQCVTLPEKIFSKFRKAEANWAIAVEANAAHEASDTRFLAIPYLDAVLSRRVIDRTINLQPIRASQGWFANTMTHEIAPASQYKGNPLEAAWLPDERTARKWQQYSRMSEWNRVRHRLCRLAEKLFVFRAMPSAAASCYPNKISFTQKPAAPVDVRVENVRVETTEKSIILTWRFLPDLENGLPSFRVYRDGSLVKTFQGQGHNFGDAPEPSQVALAFRDEHPQDSLYTVSAFNALGESVSEPAKLIGENQILTAVSR